MKSILTSALRTSTVALLAGSLVACGPDDMQAGGLSHMAISDGPGDAWGPETLAQLGGDYLPGLDALPMTASYGNDYGYAPSWDYRGDGYAAFDDGGAQYDGFAGYEDGYLPYDDYAPMRYGDAGSYMSSPGSDEYALLALAAVVAMVIGNSPPDYGFAYSDAQPWAWRMHDGYMRYAEPVRGGYRYYYYEPNMARPFLVRDPYYSYGYRGDRVVVVYDRYGRVVDRKSRHRLERAASSYRVRGVDLYRAGRDLTHYGVPARLWESRRVALAADHRALKTAREQQTAWQHWDTRNADRLAKRWQPEQQIRTQAVHRYDDWRKAAYRGPAPQFYETRHAKVEERRVKATQLQRDRTSPRLSDRQLEQHAEAKIVNTRQAQHRLASEQRAQRVPAHDVRNDRRVAQRQNAAITKGVERREDVSVQQRQRREAAQAQKRANAGKKLAFQRAQEAQTRNAQRERAAVARKQVQRQHEQAAQRQQAQREQAQRRHAQRKNEQVSQRQQAARQQTHRIEAQSQARARAEQMRGKAERAKPSSRQASLGRDARADRGSRQDKARRLVARD